MEDIKLIKKFIPDYWADHLFKHLSENVGWNDTLFIQGTDQPKKISRKMAYMSDTPEVYKYANLYFQGVTWDRDLEILKDRVEEVVFKPFNSVLLNMYKDGKDIINWHADKEETLRDNPVIACVNLGATRKFWFKKIDKTGDPFFYEVANGDLLVMGENCQKTYLHAILKEAEVEEPRISLTFRYNFNTD